MVVTRLMLKDEFLETRAECQAGKSLPSATVIIELLAPGVPRTEPTGGRGREFLIKEICRPGGLELKSRPREIASGLPLT